MWWLDRTSTTTSLLLKKISAKIFHRQTEAIAGSIEFFGGPSTVDHSDSPWNDSLAVY